MIAIYNRKDLKRDAKALLHDSTPHFMLVALVYVLLTTGLNYLLDMLSYTGGFFNGLLSTFANILLILFTMVMNVGITNYSLRLSRKEPTGMGSLFEGFSFTGRSLAVNLLVVVFTVLWALLATVAAGVLMALLISGSHFLVSDTAAAVFFSLVMFLIYVALIVVIVVVLLRYSMALFVLVDDPGLGAGECIRRSKTIMKGNKGTLFVLLLSFIGWSILIGLIQGVCQGIGLVLLGPDQLLLQLEAIAGLTDPDAIVTAVRSFMYNLQYQMRWWVILGEVLALPLTLWLTVYQLTAVARFYNNVSGYDYHQYMHDTPPDSIEPPGGYYHSPSDPTEGQ